MEGQLERKPHRIVFWRWKLVEFPEPIDPADILKQGEAIEGIDKDRYNRLMLHSPKPMTPRKVRELLVKWKGLSRVW